MVLRGCYFYFGTIIENLFEQLKGKNGNFVVFYFRMCSNKTTHIIVEGDNDVRYSIGIDIGGTTIACGIVNQNGDLIQQEIVDSDPSDKEKMFAQVVKCVGQLMNHSSIPLKQIDSIGAGVPGKVDRDNGVAVFQNNLPWDHFPIAKRMQEAFHVDKVVIDNDVHMAAYAEWKKAKLNKHSLFVYMTISTGISCAIIQAGKFIRGAGFEGEIGLVPVHAAYEDVPFKRLEKTASGPALKRHAIKRFDDDTMTSKKVFQAYYGGDLKAVNLIDDITTTLSQGVYMISSLLDPHQIVFGGSVVTHNPVLLKVLSEKLDGFLIEEQKHVIKTLALSQLGNEQGMIGAGLSALENEY